MLERSDWRLVAACSLAAGSTLLSSAVSAAAGWSRGDSALNSSFWASLGVLATAATHLLIAISRKARWTARLPALLLWVACAVFVVVSHASYFVSSQQARRDDRASHVAPPTSIAVRPLSKVMAERAKLENSMERLAHTPCEQECAQFQRKVAALRSQIVVLDQEAVEIRRSERSLRDYDAVTKRARSDPAMLALADLLRVSADTIQLVLGLLVGVLLDGLGCVAWVLVFAGSSKAREVMLPRAVTPAGDPNSLNAAAGLAPSLTPPLDRHHVGPKEEEADRLATLLERAKAGMRSGVVRNTVRSLRKFLGCAQDTAIVISRTLKQE